VRSTGGRLRITGYAAAQVLLAVPLLVVFVFFWVGGATAIIVVGMAILGPSLSALRWMAERHRSMAATVLGAPMPAGYRPLPEGDPFRRVLMQLGDPMTWREVAWVVYAVSFGFVLSLLGLLLLVIPVLGVLWYFGIEPIMVARSNVDRFFLTRGHTERLAERVQVLTESRADAVDDSAAELRRLERDLHDGTQARLVALSMNLGLAEDLLASDPEAARQMVAEARSTTTAALGDLRTVVRGIHPPVLADRGLVGAVEALAIDLSIPVDLQLDLAGRPSGPVESAVYFAISECLANVVKHSGAANVWVRLGHDRRTLRAVVGDDGRGGADQTGGTGMRGVARRLAAFDGTMRVSSPRGGPTIVTLEVPCDLSSPKTTHSSAKDSPGS
jgi:signal transduction histidine kinase